MKETILNCVAIALIVVACSTVAPSTPALPEVTVPLEIETGPTIPTPVASPIPDTVPTPVVVVNPTPSTPPVIASPKPNRGWDPAYTSYVQKNATPAMLSFPAPSFCPSWKSLSAADKSDMWAAVLESTALAETGLNRLDMYREDEILTNNGLTAPDPVTGKTIVSEGLLQVSYGDKECVGVFDYPSDKAAFLDDFSRFPAAKDNAEISSTHPERTILDPYKNLECGIKIWTSLINTYGNKPALLSIGSHYWSTARAGNNTDMINHFKNRMPKCFK